MHVELYTKDKCPFCFKAKALLKDRSISFTEHRLGVDFTREMLVEKYSTAKTYPVIVVDGFFIGGYENLDKMLNESADSNQVLLNERND